MSRAHRLRWSPSSGEPIAGHPTPETEVAGEACIVTDSGVELVGVHPRELFAVGLAVVDEGPARSFERQFDGGSVAARKWRGSRGGRSFFQRFQLRSAYATGFRTRRGGPAGPAVADGASFRSATEADSGTAPPRSRGGPAEPGIAEGASSRAGAWSAAAVAAGAESFPSRRRREQGSKVRHNN